MPNNIVIISTIEEINGQVASLLADKLGIFYMDIDNLINYNISNQDEIASKISVEYLQKLIDKQIKSIANFENTVISGKLSMILNEKYMNELKRSSIVIYLYFDKNNYKNYCIKDNNISPIDKINLVMYQDNVTLCKKFCDIEIECDEIETNIITDNVISKLKGYYNIIKE